MNTQEQLRPGAIFEGDTVVGQLPDGDWLLMAPAHTFKRLEWGCYGERIGADGTGRENTDKLLKAGSPAAAYCRTGLDKPYDLPSCAELDLLYRKRAALDLSEVTWAWSSTEYSSYCSWNQRFSDGTQFTSGKFFEFWVVPVRRISPLNSAEGEAASLREQRDELLAALEMVMRRGRIDDSEEAMNQVAAAIAKAKGGSQ